MTQPVFRFAPSPNGPLHLGHAYSALTTARWAKEAGGRFLLRIEDIDTIRCKKEFVDLVYEDLAWLGLAWEEPARRQRQHFAEYIAAMERLHHKGLLYSCFCNRRELAEAGRDQPRDPDGKPVYSGTCRRLMPEERYARHAAQVSYCWRLDMAWAMAQMWEAPLTFLEEGSGPGGETGLLECRPQDWGDVIIARKDIGTSYHLAVVHDDALQGITHVTRGRDLFRATDVHRLLQRLLDLPEPVYRHHGLIGDETGRKLSKSAGDRSLRSMREAGVTAAEIRAALGFA